MKLSIITPTHDPAWLKELEDSILANTYQDWEWIILINNGARYTSTDKRIKVIQSKTNSTKVGELKKEACSYAKGEAILEVDHDDLITPDCLVKVANAFKSDSEVGFVYSDNAKLDPKFSPYDSYYGWTHRFYEFEGQKLFVMNSQPLTPARFGHIWFAPDHIRSWRKSVYDSIGGHNEELSICDDLDLMHRLYMVTKFKHIPETLYIYRLTGENTYLKRYDEIQQTSQQIYFTNIETLMKRYCQLNNLFMIDLCGGFGKPNDYISIDLENGDITADLNKGIPFRDGSCGIVRAYDALEHLKDSRFIMSEIHRVLGEGGMLLSFTPSTDGRGAWQDPTHVSFFNENSFHYYLRKEQMRFIGNKDVKFFESWLRTYYPSEYHKRNHIYYVEAFLEKI